MAGHSKWAQIKRKKAVTDARRGQLFTRLLREITVSARLGGGDPAGNPRLRAALEEAKTSSVPKENIERALQKGSGELAGEVYEELELEGYGPGGVAVLVEAATDNRNRTVAEIRHAFAKHGGNLGESGCVAWQFSRHAYFALASEALDEERLIALALALSVEDVHSGDEVHELLAPAEAFGEVLGELEKRGLEPVARALVRQAQTTVDPGLDEAARSRELLEALDRHDDVQRVWSNLESEAGAADAEGAR